MALETGTYISDLNVSNPANTDGVTQADDHLRLIKSTVKATFPNITGAVTPTQADLNKLTSAGNPQFSTIELGAASDTTLSRVSAGVIAVEGVAVPLNSITNTHTAQQIELGHTSDTTITRSAAGVLAVEGGVIPKENRANTFSVDQLISTGASQALLSLQANAAVAKTIQFLTGATSRWVVSSEATAESGSDAGSNFIINRYNDAGSYLGTPLLVNRATGVSAFEGLAVTSSGGLGYGTGSGGAVTQLTSKSTTVTLNKTNGQITMNNAALAAGASVVFTLLNNTLSATDVLIVVLSSGVGAATAYRTEVVNSAAGGANIRLTNVSGGSLSEAAVLNFAVIKAVTS